MYLLHYLDIIHSCIREVFLLYITNIINLPHTHIPVHIAKQFYFIVVKTIVLLTEIIILIVCILSIQYF